MPWHKSDTTKSQLEAAGFADVNVQVYTEEINKSAEEIIPFMAMTGPAMTMLLWSKEDIEKHQKPWLAALDQHFKDKYPNGTTGWYWKAIVGTAQKPA